MLDPATEPVPAPDAPVAMWANGITLAQATINQDADGPTGVTLDWWSGTTVQQDYTLFVQVLDGENHVLAQMDQEPRPVGSRWQRPTSTWRAGDAIPDTVTWPPADTSAWTQVIAGWYDAEGVRLPLADGQDHVVLAERGMP